MQRTPEDIVQGAAVPDSKPVLPSSWVEPPPPDVDTVTDEDLLLVLPETLSVTVSVTVYVLAAA